MSDHCYDILVRMLEKDPTKRISIPEIMEHTWIVDLRKSKRKRDRGIFGQEELREEDDIPPIATQQQDLGTKSAS
jgi:serine/threonine protein kinase